MLRLILSASLILTPVKYKNKLVKEMIMILKKHQECSDWGYDKIYYNLAIYSMIDNEFDRYQYVMALRKKCKNKLSKWELGR